MIILTWGITDNSMKKRDLSLDYIRILAILMIVVFHFAGTWGINNARLLFFANGTWGSLGTALFFMLSGYLLRKHYSKISNIFSFYKKRWLSIFPAFYIAFLVAFLINAIRLGELFYKGEPIKLIYTLIGFDNFVTWYGVSTYALVGEWFTAIIVILYLLFPFLNKLMTSAKWSISVIFALFYVIYSVYIKAEWYPDVPAEISIVTCGFVFWVGMLVSDYEDCLRKSYITGIVTLLITVFLMVKNLGILLIFEEHITALFIFLTMLILLKNIKGTGKSAGVISYFSEVSYAVYLTHHYCINMLALVRKKSVLVDNCPAIIVFCVYFVIVLLASMLLEYIVRKLLSIKLYKTSKKTS